MKIAISSNLKKKLHNFAKINNLDLLILFGSRAQNKQRENSDYDLAFYKKNTTSKEEIKLHDELENILEGRDYDLINLDTAHNIVLKHEIFRYGICIYQKNKKIFEKHKESSYFDYIDSQTLLKPTKEKYLAQSL